MLHIHNFMRDGALTIITLCIIVEGPALDSICTKPVNISILLVTSHALETSNVSKLDSYVNGTGWFNMNFSKSIAVL